MSYVDVRDRFTGDEFLAWLAFFERWDKEAELRKQQAEHDNVMSAAAKALR